MKSQGKGRGNENGHHFFPSSQMDFDLDIDWPMDQIFSVSSPKLLPANSDHLPCSPLWTFSDDNNNNNNNNNNNTNSYDRCFADFKRFDSSKNHLNCVSNPDTRTESAFVNDEKKRLPSPLVGFMPMDNTSNLEGPCIIKERMAQALRYFKDSSEQHILAQVWAPVKKGGHSVLTTSGQPFVLDHNSTGLHQYRLVSLMYMFTVDGDTDGVLGLPGRVFQQKLPEWTPNVQYYSSKEFPRLNHALNYNVRGTLALPVFEPSGQSCVGVLELIMTSPMINYAPEVDKVCKALEAVNLKSSEILEHQSPQICNEGRQNALAEILEIITVVCETHSLPLAQTWVPCRHRNVLANGGGFKKTCSSFDGSCMGKVCMSTTDVAFYVVDAHLWGFRDACVEHHLQKGQGVAGRAFASHKLSFCGDITEFCKTEYPLVHYARMFGLRSSFAICLRSKHTGDDEYVIEFFLPSNIESYSEQQTLLNSLLMTMKEHFGSLQVASGKDLDHEWRSIEIIKVSRDDELSLMPGVAVTSPPELDSVPNKEIMRVDSFESHEPLVEYNDATDVKGNAQNGAKNKSGKKPERKRGKAEKTISLEVLQQYFAGSLKDAAKSLGVCPTTMKRICRQHGISRWPSRKINKVNRSLSKLKRVIESVQGGDGTFGLSSLDPRSVPVAVGSISWAANVNEAKQQSSPNSKPTGYQEEANNLPIFTPSIPNGQLGSPNQIPGDKTTRNGKLSRTWSVSKEESIGTPTSQGSCQGSPNLRDQTTPQNDPTATNVNENCINVEKSMELLHQQNGDFKSFHFSTPFKGMLVEDAGSSHDLRNLCAGGEPVLDEHLTEYSWTRPPCPDTTPRDCLPAPADLKPQFTARPEIKTVTIKATYREDIIRFRLDVDSGIVKLKEEVAKRLKLELGTFDIKYLDDDHEWVLIACDTDLQECVDVLSSSGNNIIRLLVHDIIPNLGSSCESSGD